MAKKAELLEEASKLKLTVTQANTIAEIEAAIAGAKAVKGVDKEVITERKADVAKSGKRSEKAREEAKEKAEKEARKEAGDTTPIDPSSVENKAKGPASPQGLFQTQSA